MNRTWIVGGFIRCEDGAHGATESVFRRVRERRMAGGTARSVRRSGPRLPRVAPKRGCTTETLRRRVRQSERDTGQRADLTTDDCRRLKELERNLSVPPSRSLFKLTVPPSRKTIPASP